MLTARPFILTAGLSLTSLAFADDRPRSEEEILKSIKVPNGYEATVFAKPPEVGYPTACSASVDGTLFLAVDENGSLDTKPNRGRVYRLRDTDGDGRADEQKVFAEMDSPRGVIWDGPRGNGPGTVYVMHPPTLTAYTDVDGDGKADQQEDIVTGLGFDLKFRGADHTTNGCRLGIDGYIYIAVGDYGYVEAKGKDGTTIKNRGGGIVRVRTDGTGLEIVSRGQRNIYDVAVSSTLDLFTRDNTNDGGGWDVRLSYVPPGAHMGYPYLFQNFPEDMLKPLADYGGGSPCGALWMDEPGLPKGLFTVEWGRNAIMLHGLKPKGAGWETEGRKQGQTEWLELVRPTDMDVDASGRIFITSWDGATFNYNNLAGYVLQVTKKNAPKVEVPDLSLKTGDEIADAKRLLGYVGSNSASLRLAAQRELIRRLAAHPSSLQGVRGGDVLNLADEKAKAGEMGAAYAANWAFIQSSRGHIQSGSGSPQKFEALSPDWRLMEMRQLADPTLNSADEAMLRAGLRDSDARVRCAAINAARHQRGVDVSSAILPLVGESDPVITHLAVRALSELKASQVCLTALDSADEKIKPGALRVLYSIYDQAVVDGLIERLNGSQGEFRRNLLNALCRLYNQDTPYTDPKVWWGTRPDTSGPVYQPMQWSASPQILAALKKELDSASDDDALWLAQRMSATKVNFPELNSLMLSKAKDVPAKLSAVDAIAKIQMGLTDELISLLLGIVADEKVAPQLRARALRHFQRTSDWDRELSAGLTAMAPFVTNASPQSEIAAVVNDYTHDPKLAKLAPSLQKMAAEGDASKRNAAITILVNLGSSALVKDKEKERTERAIAKLWEHPETTAALLAVIAHTKAKSYADQVRTHLKDPNNAVAEAALFAYQSLGLKDTGASMQTIGQMKYEEVFAAVQKGGDASQGKEMFLRASCVACHTITADEPPKGPILSAVAKIYDRAALTESILKPNAKLAQGFESAWFKTKKGEQVEGFVTREGGDSVDVRNIAGQTLTLEKGDIAERGHRPQSMMPEGLLNSFSPAELANLLAYLESLKGK